MRYENSTAANLMASPADLVVPAAPSRPGDCVERAGDIPGRTVGRGRRSYGVSRWRYSHERAPIGFVRESFFTVESAFKELWPAYEHQGGTGQIERRFRVRERPLTLSLTLSLTLT